VKNNSIVCPTLLVTDITVARPFHCGVISTRVMSVARYALRSATLLRRLCAHAAVCAFGIYKLR
jgi:hypothetical protein